MTSATLTTSNRRKIGWTAICLGGFGVHKFLLGYRGAGIIMLLIGVLGWWPFAIPTVLIGIVGIIEGIIYLNKTDAEFDRIYVQGRREWF